MAGSDYFEKLPRAKQRLNLLRRLNRVRREMEQQLIDLEYYNELQRSRGGETIPIDPQRHRDLAHVDQQIRQIRDSRL